MFLTVQIKYSLIKKILFSILFVLISFGSFGKTIKILAIGNSFSRDVVETNLYELGQSDGVTFVIGNMYIGSCDLELHWKNASNNAADYEYRKIVNGVRTNKLNTSLETAITDENWDYITFQQARGMSGLYNTYFPYLPNLMTYVKSKATNPNVIFALHSTWAFQQDCTHPGFAYYRDDQMTMYNAYQDVIPRVAAEVGIEMILPSGTAVQNGRTSYLGDTFCVADGYHLNLIGRYTTACTWYEKITQNPVVGNKFIAVGISNIDGLILQKAANYAVINPYSITDMSGEYTPPNPETYQLKSPINIDFGNEASITPSPWNNLTSYSKGSNIQGLLDMDGEATPLKVEILEAFAGINTGGPTFGLNIGGWNILRTAMQDSFYGNAGDIYSGKIVPSSVLSVSNLNLNQKYEIRLFTSRTANGNRETSFLVEGTTSQSFFVNSSSNSTVLTKAENVTPKPDGTIKITVGAGPNNNQVNKFFYLNALQIRSYDNESSVNFSKNHQSEISIFVNRISKRLTVEGLNENTSYTYLIVGIDGKLLKKGILNEKNEIGVENLLPGFYIIGFNNLLNQNQSKFTSIYL